LAIYGFTRMHEREFLPSCLYQEHAFRPSHIMFSPTRQATLSSVIIIRESKTMDSSTTTPNRDLPPTYRRHRRSSGSSFTEAYSDHETNQFFLQLAQQVLEDDSDDDDDDDDSFHSDSDCSVTLALILDLEDAEEDDDLSVRKQVSFGDVTVFEYSSPEQKLTKSSTAAVSLHQHESTKITRPPSPMASRSSKKRHQQLFLPHKTPSWKMSTHQLEQLGCPCFVPPMVDKPLQVRNAKPDAALRPNQGLAQMA